MHFSKITIWCRDYMECAEAIEFILSNQLQVYFVVMKLINIIQVSDLISVLRAIYPTGFVWGSAPSSSLE
jgi:hypothetical protein